MAQYDVAIIGAGPGGYVAAIRARQLGLKVALIERDKAGGVCLNVGCIPSKALIHQAEVFTHAQQLTELGATLNLQGFKYKKVYEKSRNAAETLSKGVQFLIKKNKIDYLEGRASFKDATHLTIEKRDGSQQVVEARNIIIATGSRPRELKGFEFDEKQIISSTGALFLQKLPKSIIILGAGVIGMEFAHIMNAFGVKVTMVEMLDQILAGADVECASRMRTIFEGRTITFYTSTQAQKVHKSAAGIKLSLQGAQAPSELSAEMLLVAIGRTPNIEDLNLDNVGINTHKGAISTHDYYQTSVPNIFAIGDAIATPQLAHVASKEGEIVAEHIAGQQPRHTRFPDALYPSAVYTDPELAFFGPTEAQLKKDKVAYEKSTFPYRGAGKSVAIDATEGQATLYFGKEHHEFLAAHIIGKHATELVHELLLAKQAELLPEDVADMVHAHPTLSEVSLEASRAAEGWAIHT